MPLFVRKLYNLCRYCECIFRIAYFGMQYYMFNRISILTTPFGWPALLSLKISSIFFSFFLSFFLSFIHSFIHSFFLSFFIFVIRTTLFRIKTTCEFVSFWKTGFQLAVLSFCIFSHYLVLIQI